jgi:hypothetical protein
VHSGSLSNAALVGAKTVNGPFAFESVYETGGFDCSNEGRVVLRVDRVLNDVFRGVRGGAADLDGLFHHLCKRRGDAYCAESQVRRE